MFRRLRRKLQALREERRVLGWRGTARKHGWSVLLAVVALYLVRDVLLYVVLPLMVAKAIAE